jgi:hypothetical protein
LKKRKILRSLNSLFILQRERVVKTERKECFVVTIIWSRDDASFYWDELGEQDLKRDLLNEIEKDKEEKKSKNFGSTFVWWMI